MTVAQRPGPGRRKRQIQGAPDAHPGRAATAPGTDGFKRFRQAQAAPVL